MKMTPLSLPPAPCMYQDLVSLCMNYVTSCSRRSLLTQCTSTLTRTRSKALNYQYTGYKDCMYLQTYVCIYTHTMYMYKCLSSFCKCTYMQQQSDIYNCSTENYCILVYIHVHTQLHACTLQLPCADPYVHVYSVNVCLISRHVCKCTCK